MTIHRVFEIAPGIKNTEWLALKLTLHSPLEDWEKGIYMFDIRLKRFTEPIRVLMEHKDQAIALYSGFAIIALDCLLIETLCSFRMGRKNALKNNNIETRNIFIDFLTQGDSFKLIFDESKAEIFYNHFRCGILHQGEVKSSGRIRIDTHEMIQISNDSQSLIVNRWLFHQSLLQEIEHYKDTLRQGKDKKTRRNFIKKMNYISHKDDV